MSPKTFNLQPILLSICYQRRPGESKTLGPAVECQGSSLLKLRIPFSKTCKLITFCPLLSQLSKVRSAFSCMFLYPIRFLHFWISSHQNAGCITSNFLFHAPTLELFNNFYLILQIINLWDSNIVGYDDEHES